MPDEECAVFCLACKLADLNLCDDHEPFISDAQLLLAALKQDGLGIIWVDQSKWDA